MSRSTTSNPIAIVTDRWRLPNTADKPFISGTWRMMYHLLKVNNFPTNAVDFIDLETLEGREGNYELIIGLGRKVLKHYRPKDRFDAIRGSVLQEDKTTFIFTYHPDELKKPYSMFRDDPIEASVIFSADLRKAKDVYVNGWVVPEERFNLEPTLNELKDFTQFVVENKPLLGADIEATGLNLEHSEVVVIGFAWTESDCFVLPLRALNGASYWAKGDIPEVNKCLDLIFKHGRFLFQNGVGYDVPLLIQQGYNFVLENYTDETMFLHHVISPELPHNIGFISSFYGKMPYWKESFLTKKEHIFETDQIEMRRYNARDCVALIQMYQPMLDEVKEKGLEDFYRKEMALAPIVIKAKLKGLKLSQRNLKAWRHYIDSELTKAKRTIYSLRKLPQAFNLNSSQHKNYLLFNEPIPAFRELDDKLKDYIKPIYNWQFECLTCKRKKSIKFRCDQAVPEQVTARCGGCKADKKLKLIAKGKKCKNKSKESNVYKELLELKEVRSVKPFYQPRGFVPSRTDSGLSTDRAALTRYIHFLTKRLDELDNLKRKVQRHLDEEKELKDLQKFIAALLNYNKLEKLRSSFYNYKTWRDGKVHPTALIQGTATARFSYKDPNLQQIPSKEIGKKARSCFEVDEDQFMLSVDFSNLEVQVGARIMSDDILIAQLETGANLHDENTKVFFDANKGTKRFNILRPVSKTIQFGRLFYGGTDNGIYAKVIAENPDCGLTLKHFKEAVESYIKAHPAYAKWADAVRKMAREERVAVNGYGRKRYLYGSLSQVERQGLNTPIQGTAAEVVQDDMIDCDRAFKERNLKTFIALQIHDELLFIGPKTELREVWHEIVKPIMSRERTINGYKFKIPIDAELGPNWGTMGKFDEDTFELIGDSKH